MNSFNKLIKILDSDNNFTGNYEYVEYDDKLNYTIIPISSPVDPSKCVELNRGKIAFNDTVYAYVLYDITGGKYLAVFENAKCANEYTADIYEPFVKLICTKYKPDAAFVKESELFYTLIHAPTDKNNPLIITDDDEYRAIICQTNTTDDKQFADMKNLTIIDVDQYVIDVAKSYISCDDASGEYDKRVITSEADYERIAKELSNKMSVPAILKGHAVWLFIIDELRYGLIYRRLSRASNVAAVSDAIILTSYGVPHAGNSFVLFAKNKQSHNAASAAITKFREDNPNCALYFCINSNRYVGANVVNAIIDDKTINWSSTLDGAIHVYKFN